MVCAARIRAKLVTETGASENYNYEGSAAIVEEAKRFLKEYPHLLPKLSSDGDEVAQWPPEALRFLGENYVPESRRYPLFAVVDRGTGERLL